MMETAAAGDETQARAHREAWLRRRLQPWCGAYRTVLACTVLSGWLVIPQAALIAASVERMVSRQAPPPASWLIGLALVMLARAASNTLGQYVGAGVVEAVQARMRVDIATALHAHGPAWLRQRHGSTLAESSLGHVDATEGYYAGYLPARAECLWVPLPILLMVFMVDWVAGLALLSTVPLILLFMLLVGRGAEAAGRAQLQALARAGAHFADRLRGLDLIRAYGRGRAERLGVAAAADTLRDRSLQVLRIAFLSSAVLEFFASLGVALVAVYFGFGLLGLLHLRAGGVSLGGGLLCLLLAPEFYAPLRRLAAHYHDRANALAAVGDIERLSERLPGTHTVVSGPAETPPAGVAVQARALVVRHASRSASPPQRLTFTLAVGERLALVGPSGSGKSTLLEAIAGWLEPEHGRLQVSRGCRLALAGQRPWLFRGSIADNIRLGDPDADRRRVRAAAEAAQVMSFAERLPAGLNTVIGERGFGLSGGQARRVALARIFLNRPDLLLLDEPTAFLDRRTEAAVLAALAEFCVGRTLVVATHSPAVVAWAGRALSLADGSDVRAVGGRAG